MASPSEAFDAQNTESDTVSTVLGLSADLVADDEMPVTEDLLEVASACECEARGLPESSISRVQQQARYQIARAVLDLCGPDTPTFDTLIEELARRPIAEQERVLRAAAVQTGPDCKPTHVLDQKTGKVRVLSRQCATCIFRQDDPMHLGPQRTRQVIEANLRTGALLTCHTTLPYGPHPAFGPAVCAGYWARHRNEVLTGRLAQLFLGTLRIDPPTPPSTPTRPRATGDEHEDATLPHHLNNAEHLPTGPTPGQGTRIRLISTSDPYTQLRPGTLGTTTGTDSMGTLHVRWDDGSTLGLIPDLDKFEVIDCGGLPEAGNR
jgi:uncharacterized protein DUF4314